MASAESNLSFAATVSDDKGTTSAWSGGSLQAMPGDLFERAGGPPIGPTTVGKKPVSETLQAKGGSTLQRLRRILFSLGAAVAFLMAAGAGFENSGFKNH